MCQRLNVEEALLTKTLIAKKETSNVLQKLYSMKTIKPSRLYGLLKGYPQETLIYMMAKAKEDEAQKGISLYLSLLQDIRLSITGRDIAQLGIKPGPLYGRIMGQILWAKLDGLVKTGEEEIEFAKELLKKQEEV